MGFRSSPVVKVLVSVLSGGRSVFARRVFLYQVGTCRVQSKPRPGYFEPLWKARSRFSFHYSCFYIWGCWMSTKSLILLWILELLTGKECICAEGCMYSISATPGFFVFFSTPLLLQCFAYRVSCSLLVLYSAGRMTHLSVIQLPHDILLVHPASALTIHLPKKQTVSLNKLLSDSIIPVLQHGPVFKTIIIIAIIMQHLSELTQTDFPLS